MAVRSTTRILAAAIVFTATPALFAQSQTPAPPPCAADAKSTPQAPCTKPAVSPASTDDPFPFPGEPKTPKTPAATPPNAPAKPTTDDPFPFPGETPGSSSSSSSSSSSDNTPSPADDEPTNLDTRKHPLPRAKPQTPDEREMEDLKVARFYRDKGDFNAVYLRSKDAVQTIPDDPEAHLLLAEAALKLNKRDEAIAEFKATLQNDPDKDQKKNATRGLEALKVPPSEQK